MDLTGAAYQEDHDQGPRHTFSNTHCAYMMENGPAEHKTRGGKGSSHGSCSNLTNFFLKVLTESVMMKGGRDEHQQIPARVSSLGESRYLAREKDGT